MCLKTTPDSDIIPLNVQGMLLFSRLYFENVRTWDDALTPALMGPVFTPGMVSAAPQGPEAGVAGRPRARENRVLTLLKQLLGFPPDGAETEHSSTHPQLLSLLLGRLEPPASGCTEVARRGIFVSFLTFPGNIFNPSP